MFGKKSAEIARLKCRIAELEGRLCPFGSHDWVQVGRYFTDYGFGMGDKKIVEEYECKRCGKKRQSTFPEIERILP